VQYCNPTADQTVTLQAAGPRESAYISGKAQVSVIVGMNINKIDEFRLS